MLKLKPKPYPTKTTINLLIKEQPGLQLPAFICLCVVLAVLLTAFGKFAVADKLTAAAQAESAALQAERQLAALQDNNAAYSAVRAEYARYFSAAVTQELAVAADCLDVLSLVESHLMDGAAVSSFDFNNATLSVRLTSTDLERTSNILANLSSNPQVAGVAVYTANDSGQAAEDGATIVMTITLVTEAGDRG